MIAPIINTLGTLITLATPGFVEASRSSAARATATATNGKTRLKEAVLIAGTR
jgi:hypothetical protein